MRHSPVPWRLLEMDKDDQTQNEIVDAEGEVITHDASYYPDAPEIHDMRFIVAAVNFYASHLAEQSTSQTRNPSQKDSV